MFEINWKQTIKEYFMMAGYSPFAYLLFPAFIVVAFIVAFAMFIYEKMF